MSPDVIYFILFLLFAVYKQQQFVHIDNPSVAVFEWRYYALFHYAILYLRIELDCVIQYVNFK